MENPISVSFLKKIEEEAKKKKNQDKFFPKMFDLPQQRHFCLCGDLFVRKPSWQLKGQEE